MLKDGLYDLTYQLVGAPDQTRQTALVVLRDDKVLGSDRWGGVFEGRRTVDPATGVETLAVRFRLPPGGVLVTSSNPSVTGELIALSVQLDPTETNAAFIVLIAGQPVRFSFEYRGQLPD
jgi:hypothetical protein